jgi:outer membrane protein X
MKKFLFLSVLLLGVAFTVQSQDFKPFRVDGGLGYGIPFGNAYDGGVLFYLEPKYEIASQIAVGLRWEGTLFAGAAVDGESASASLSSGYLATGDYYFNNNKFRPFAGIGLGLHRIAGVSIDDESIEGEGKTNFGGLVRAGFDVSHFRFTLSYNYAGKIGNETHHYLGVTAGFYIGGGKK